MAHNCHSKFNEFLFDRSIRLNTLVFEAIPEFLKTKPKISNPYPNVDLGSGVLLHSVGLEAAEFYTVLFGISRALGIVASTGNEKTCAGMFHLVFNIIFSMVAYPEIADRAAKVSYFGWAGDDGYQSSKCECFRKCSF